MEPRRMHAKIKLLRITYREKNYKNETNFTLEKYVKQLKGIFDMLEKDRVTLNEEQNLGHLLDHITPKIEN